MLILDLFCGAGGAAKGYTDAGHTLEGVDIKPQPDYPYPFHQADIFELPENFFQRYDIIHASPPCQAYTLMNNINTNNHPKHIAKVRTILEATGKPWIIENVLGAKPWMRNPIQLHGGHFGLNIWRPRLFENTIGLPQPPWRPRPQTDIPIYGRPPTKHIQQQAATEMGINWTNWHGIKEAIPPAYTKWIGQHLANQPAPITPMPTLHCIKCGNTRPDPVDHYCRPCRAETMRRYRARKKQRNQPTLLDNPYTE